MMLNKKFIMVFMLAVIVVFVAFTNQAKAGIVEKGLVSYYSFNNIKGDVAKDDWGKNNGTIIGPKVTKGKYGDALEFDGQDDYVNCGNNDSLNLTKAISIEAWVYMKSPGNYPTVVSKSITNWGYIFEFLTTTGKINLYLDSANPSWVNVANSAVPLEKWTHIAATYDGKKIRYYFNGAPDGSYDATKAENSSNADNVHIGRRRLSEPHNF